ncbi:MAG: lamin tail domain-containing protein [Caldilineaceae bacterium]
MTPTPHRLFLSEILADADAVNDSRSEWIEIYNPGPTGVDLAGWILNDRARDNHVIEGAVWSLRWARMWSWRATAINPVAA